MPLKENTGRFAATPKEIRIPEQRFTNEELPNLRGHYLKEMMLKKTESYILLEGSVSDEVDKEDRNAVIHLFIPEHLVEQYSLEE